MASKRGERFNQEFPLLSSIRPGTSDAASTAEFSVDFPFSNATAAPLVIRKFNCACSGLRSEISGKLYEIEAVPVNSAILGLAVLKLETDCPLPCQQLHQAFLVVRKPPARPAAP